MSSSLHNSMRSTDSSRSGSGIVMDRGAKHELSCPVCMHLYRKPVMLSCGHSFCSECSRVWLEDNDSCPVCRNVTNMPIRNYALEQIVDQHRRCLSEVKSKRNLREFGEIIGGEERSVDIGRSESFTRETGVRRSCRVRSGMRRMQLSRSSTSSIVSASSMSTSVTTSRLSSLAISEESLRRRVSVPVDAPPSPSSTVPTCPYTPSDEEGDTPSSPPPRTFQRSTIVRRSDMVRPSESNGEVSSFGRQSFLRRSLNMLKRKKKYSPANASTSAILTARQQENAHSNPSFTLTDEVERTDCDGPSSLTAASGHPLPSQSLQSVPPSSASLIHKKSVWKRLFGRKANNKEQPKRVSPVLEDQEPVPSTTTTQPIFSLHSPPQPEFGGIVSGIDGGIVRFGRGKEILVAVVGGRRVGKTTLLSRLPDIMPPHDREELSGQADTYPRFVVSQALLEEGEVCGVVDMIEVDHENEALVNSVASICDAIVCVFSLSDPSSILSVMMTCREIGGQRKRMGLSEKVPTALIGTLSPGSLLETDQSMITRTAKKLGARYTVMEVTDGNSLTEVISDLIRTLPRESEC